MKESKVNGFQSEAMSTSFARFLFCLPSPWREDPIVIFAHGGQGLSKVAP